MKNRKIIRQVETMYNLDFRQPELSDYESVWDIMARYGENSCQHSFVSMYSLQEKYGDTLCCKDGFVYVLRKHLCRGSERVYLFPIGGGDKKNAVEVLMEDAHLHGTRMVFSTVTQGGKEFIEKEFPGRFLFSEYRDYAEYLYSTAKIATLPGEKLKNKRNEINRFYRDYGSQIEINPISHNDFHDILDFEDRWLTQNSQNHDKDNLLREARVIRLQLQHYHELHLSGIVIRRKGVVCGYGYGTPLSNNCYDALIEKGDRNIPYIYRILFQESVRCCAMNYEYVNREEDVGVIGLRESKMAYHPELILKKYKVTEI